MASQNGKIRKSEFLAYINPPPIISLSIGELGDFFHAADKDGDGSITVGLWPRARASGCSQLRRFRRARRNSQLDNQNRRHENRATRVRPHRHLESRPHKFRAISRLDAVIIFEFASAAFFFSSLSLYTSQRKNEYFSLQNVFKKQSKNPQFLFIAAIGVQILFVDF